MASSYSCLRTGLIGGLWLWTTCVVAVPTASVLSSSSISSNSSSAISSTSSSTTSATSSFIATLPTSGNGQAKLLENQAVQIQSSSASPPTSSLSTLSSTSLAISRDSPDGKVKFVQNQVVQGQTSSSFSISSSLSTPISSPSASISSLGVQYGHDRLLQQAAQPSQSTSSSTSTQTSTSNSTSNFLLDSNGSDVANNSALDSKFTVDNKFAPSNSSNFSPDTTPAPFARFQVHGNGSERVVENAQAQKSITAAPNGTSGGVYNLTKEFLEAAEAAISNSSFSVLLTSCANPYTNYMANLLSDYVHTQAYTGIPYSRPPECSSALASYCLIYVDGVDLLYWPTPYAAGAIQAAPATKAPNATMTRAPQMKRAEKPYVSDGFTFEPNSAYLVYKNARAWLPFNTNSSQTGPLYPRMTIPYPAADLSTYYDCDSSTAQGMVWPASQINFQDMNSPPRWSVVSSQRPCHVWSISGDSLQDQTFPPADIATQYTEYVNEPIVLLPGPLSSMDPAWANCQMGDTGIGLYDPPRAIIPADAMTGPDAPVAPVAQTAADTVPTPAQATAQPAAVVSSAAPPPTSVVVNLPNGDTIVDYPPAGASIQAPANQPASSSGNVVNIGTGQPNSPRPAVNNPVVAAPVAGSNGNTPQAQSNNNDVAAAPIAAAPAAANINNNQPAQVQGQGTNPSNNQPGQVQGQGDDFHPGTAPAVAGQVVNSGGQENAVVQPNNGQSQNTGSQQVNPGQPGNNQAQVVPQGFAGTNTQTGVSSQPAPAPQPVSVGEHLVQAAPNGGVTVDGVTVDNKQPVANAGGLQVSLGSNGVVVGGNVIDVPQLTTPGHASTPISLNGHSVQIIQGASPGSQSLVVDGQPLPIGVSQAQVGSNMVSLIGNGQLSVIATTIPYVPITASPGSVAAGVDSNGSPVPTTPPQLGIVVDGQVITPLGSLAVVIAGSTLSTAGATATLSNGAIVTLQPGAIVEGTRTLPFHVAPPIVAAATAAAATTAPAAVYSTLADGNVVYKGATLTKGAPPVTLSDGEVVGYQSGSGNSTASSSTGEANGGIGSYVMVGLGGDATSTTISGGALPTGSTVGSTSGIKTGSASRNINPSIYWTMGLCMIFGMIVGI